jgi:hypothetical protein
MLPLNVGRQNKEHEDVRRQVDDVSVQYNRRQGSMALSGGRCV